MQGSNTRTPDRPKYSLSFWPCIATEMYGTAASIALAGYVNLEVLDTEELFPVLEEINKFYAISSCEVALGVPIE